MTQRNVICDTKRPVYATHRILCDTKRCIYTWHLDAVYMWQWAGSWRKCVPHRDFHVTQRDVYMYDTGTLCVFGSGPCHGASVWKVSRCLPSQCIPKSTAGTRDEESHVTEMRLICDMTHSYVTWLIRMWHGSFICDMTHLGLDESCHIWISHVTYGWVVSHMNESCHT